MARRARETRRFRDEVLDKLLAGADPAEVFADGGLLDDLKKTVRTGTRCGDGRASGG